MESIYAYAQLQQQYGEHEWVVPQCPRCGAEHTHGAGPRLTEARRFLGHRRAHCDAAKVPDCEQRQYWLTDDRSLHGTPFVIPLRAEPATSPAAAPAKE